jgi:hypothetical protein
MQLFFFFTAAGGTTASMNNVSIVDNYITIASEIAGEERYCFAVGLVAIGNISLNQVTIERNLITNANALVSLNGGATYLQGEFISINSSSFSHNILSNSEQKKKKNGNQIYLLK